MSDSYTILADGSAIIKPALDERSYRFLKLNNNLHVLVIHDASTDRAGASLDVNVGSFADKKYGVPGLAHFCEHLLFMGTAKYPVENTYSDYLAKHSGHSNAYTAAEHTNYYFEVGADHLEGALDRFAQFFICPLFSTSCKDREICAVDSENKKNLQNDLWRMYQLDKLTSNPAHPYNGFSTGNLATLNDEPASRGVNVRDVLLRFYNEQYSANLMSLVVLGCQSLDVLTEWVLLKFSDVPDHGLPCPFYDGCPLYAPEQMCKLTCARPIMVSNKLEVSFPIPSDMEQQWRSKPAQYYSHLLGHESKGSLLYFLKNLNWVNELSAGNMKVCQGTSLFMVELELTPDGLANWQAVLAHLFEYLHMAKLQPPQLWLWREISDMSKIDFRFRQKTGTASTVSKMSNALHKFAQNLYIPPENLLDYTILRDFDPSEITAYGAHLVPSNLRITITSQLLNDFAEQEKWYGTEYSFEDIPGDLMSRLHKVSQNPALHLPVPNTFIPKDFTVHGEKAVEPLRHPHLICDTCKFETWYKQDDTFCAPKGYINLTIHAPPLGASVEAAAMATLLCELFDDALADLKYYASIAGLSSSIFQYRDAFSLKFCGYNDELPALLELVLRKLVAFEPTEDRFEPIKYKVTKALVNAAYENPYMQIGKHFLQFVNEKTHTEAQKLAALERISFDDLSRFAKSLWEQGVFVQTLIHGNFEYAAAAQVHTLINDICKPLPAISEMAAEVYQKVKFQSHVLEAAEHARYEMVLTDPINVNSCIEYFIQIGRICAENARLRVLTDLLCVILHEPCFNQLRTKEQLGYVVFSGYRLNRSHFGMRILVQSEWPCEYLEFRIEKFLERFRTKKLGAEFTDDAFAKFKQALKLKKLTKLNNLHDECSLYWTQITDGYYDFEQKQRDVAILDTITKKEFLLFVSEHLAFGAGHKSARISVYLKSQKQPLFDRNKNFSTVVHNYMYENDHDKDVIMDVLDEIIEHSKFDTVAVADELCKKLSIADAPAFKEKFTAHIEVRTQFPTPPEYSKGQLYTLDKEFKRSHALGGRPEPVTELKSLYYPKEEARL